MPGWQRFLLIVCALLLLGIGAMSGVWMKPDHKKDKDGKVPNITVIVPPPAPRNDPLAPPPAIPDARRYPI